MIFPAATYFVHGVAPITEGIRWSINSFLGIEACVTEENRNLYGSDFWYHEAARPYNETLEQEYKKFYGLQGSTY